MSPVYKLSFAALLMISSVSATAQSSEPGRVATSNIESTASLVGVLPGLAELQKLTGSEAAADRWQILSLHQQIFEQIMAASLQVDATIAQIDNEIARAIEVRSYLADRRDRTVNRANLLSVIIGGGLGATSSGLQLSSNLTKSASSVGIAAGTVAASLALIGIRAQKGRSSRFDFESNMLAEFFDCPVLPDSRYPATVWTFLNRSAPNGPTDVTRRQQLMQTWMQVKRIESAADAKKIARLTSQPSESLELSIDDFEDRAAMLGDVRARISFLKRDLGALITALTPLRDVDKKQ